MNNNAVPSPESDARLIYLELVAQQLVSTNNLLDRHQLQISLAIDDDLIFAGLTKVLPVEAGSANNDHKNIELPGAPKENTTELRNQDSDSPGWPRPQVGGGRRKIQRRARAELRKNKG